MDNVKSTIYYVTRYYIISAIYNTNNWIVLSNNESGHQQVVWEKLSKVVEKTVVIERSH